MSGDIVGLLPVGDRVRFSEPSPIVDPNDGASHTAAWTGVIESPDAPWVIVVVTDGVVARRKEITRLRQREKAGGFCRRLGS